MLLNRSYFEIENEDAAHYDEWCSTYFHQLNLIVKDQNIKEEAKDYV